jgi:hypothetical protein
MCVTSSDIIVAYGSGKLAKGSIQSLEFAPMSLGLAADDGQLRSLDCSVNGSRIAVGFDSGRIYSVDLTGKDIVKSFTPFQGLGVISVGTISSAPDGDGRYLTATYGSDGRLVLASLNPTAARLEQIDTWHFGRMNLFQDIAIKTLQLASNGSLLAVADGVDNVHVVSIQKTGRSKREIHTYRDSSLVALAVSANGRYVVSADDQGLIQLSNIIDSQSQRLKLPSEAKVVALAFSNDETAVYATTADGRLRMLNLELGEVATSDIGRRPLATSIAEMPNKPTIVLGFDDGSLRLFDRESKTLAKESLDGHRAAVAKVIPGLTKDRFISISADGSMRVWSQPKKRAASQPIRPPASDARQTEEAQLDRFPLERDPSDILRGSIMLGGASLAQEAGTQYFAVTPNGVRRIASDAPIVNLSAWREKYQKEPKTIAASITELLRTTTTVPLEELSDLLAAANQAVSTIALSDEILRTQIQQDQKRTSEEGRELWQFVSISVTRVGALLLILFLVQIFIGLYRTIQNSRRSFQLEPRH